MTPYLILHKVRGEPAFDIAIRMCEGEVPCQPKCGLQRGEGGCLAKEEDWWIIPTSGHRAHPVKEWPLTELEGDVGQGYWAWHLSSDALWLIEEAPDHCQYSIDRKAASATPIRSLDVQAALSALIKPAAPIQRRKL